jgi:hypothetical protein
MFSKYASFIFSAASRINENKNQIAEKENKMLMQILK